MADYVFVYLKRGSHVASSPWSGDLEAAKKLARDGLIRRSVERPIGHLGKASRGCGVFVLAVLASFLAGAVAQFVGGGWE